MSDFSRREFIKRSILLSLGASYIISCDDNDMIDSINESDASDESDSNNNIFSSSLIRDFVKNGNLGPNGSFPINTNGGGLSYCHPGMYSIFTLIEACRQLWGQCGDRQLKKNLTNVLCHGTGGVLSSAATTILSKESS